MLQVDVTRVMIKAEVTLCHFRKASPRGQCRLSPCLFTPEPSHCKGKSQLAQEEE